MNNFEKIKSLTLDEMAEFFLNADCDLDKPCKKCKNEAFCSCTTKEEYLKWLLSTKN